MSKKALFGLVVLAMLGLGGTGLAEQPLSHALLPQPPSRLPLQLQEPAHLLHVTEPGGESSMILSWTVKSSSFQPWSVRRSW